MINQRSSRVVSSAKGLKFVAGTILILCIVLWIWQREELQRKGLGRQRNQEQVETVEAIDNSKPYLRSGNATQTRSITPDSQYELVSELNHALASSNSALLSAILEKIRTEPNAVVPSLILLLKIGENDAPKLAASLLRESGSPKATSALIEVYQTTNDDVLRKIVDNEILKIRSDESVEEILTYFDSGTPGGVTRLAELVLAGHGTVTVVERADALYDSTQDRSTRRSVAAVFRNLKNPVALPWLKQRIELRNQPRDKLEMYADALVSIGTEEALAILQSLAEDPDPIRRRIGEVAQPREAVPPPLPGFGAVPVAP